MAKKKKEIKVDAEVGENKISIDKTDNELHVVYDGKNRDLEYHQDEEGKTFVYDGQKLDVEVTKDKDGTEVKVEASNGFLRWIGRLMSKFVLRRKK